MCFGAYVQTVFAPPSAVAAPCGHVLFISDHITCSIELQPWSIARDLSPDGGGCDDGHALAGVKLGRILKDENSETCLV